jgi:hypothetical protein
MSGNSFRQQFTSLRNQNLPGAYFTTLKRTYSVQNQPTGQDFWLHIACRHRVRETSTAQAGTFVPLHCPPTDCQQATLGRWQGWVVYHYERPFRGGSTHVVLEPLQECRLRQFRSWPLAAISNAEIRGNRIAAFGWIAELRLKQLPIAASDPKQPLMLTQSEWLQSAKTGYSLPSTRGQIGGTGGRTRGLTCKT